LPIATFHATAFKDLAISFEVRGAGDVWQGAIHSL
jgi:hypothetical protein